MPRSFLVKRGRKQAVPQSYRARCGSEDERCSDSGSDYDAVQTNFGSPDSGYSRSPLPKDIETESLVLDGRESLPSTPASSPRSLGNIYQSPFYFSAFDKLAITSPSSSLFPDKLKYLASPSLSSPNKRRATSSDKPKAKKPKAVRKLLFDEDKSSPVSGTIIKDFSDSDDEGHVSGDIDASLNFVEVTPEAKAELEKIENKIGDYICQLCKELYDDAFQLAQHRCSRIVHVEYRCPECDKVFNCPANLASHRRWHKPRPPPAPKSTGHAAQGLLPVGGASVPAAIAALSDPLLSPSAHELRRDFALFSSEESDASSSQLSPRGDAAPDDGQFECDACGKRFRRQSYLRKHMHSHSEERQYPCQYCGKVFRSEASRSKHAAQHTVGSNDYMCTVCNNCFPNKTALERHVRVHTSELFSCKYCNATFYSSPGLTRHINKCHPSESRQVILLQLPTMTRPC